MISKINAAIVEAKKKGGKNLLVRIRSDNYEFLKTITYFGAPDDFFILDSFEKSYPDVKFICSDDITEEFTVHEV